MKSLDLDLDLILEVDLDLGLQLLNPFIVALYSSVDAAALHSCSRLRLLNMQYARCSLLSFVIECKHSIVSYTMLLNFCEFVVVS